MGGALTRSNAGHIVGPMSTRRRAETTPDLFPASPTAKAPGIPPVPQTKAQAASLQPRHFLPKNLPAALERLDDTEIDALLAAVTTEAERRGRLLPRPSEEKSTAKARPQRQAPAKHGVGSLTTGKLNAVRAVFKAGVKPSTIARQFGISRSDVRKALAIEKLD
jgi:hypothetical protein